MWKSKWDAFAGMVHESDHQANRPDSIFREDRMCVREIVECVTRYGLFIQCYIHPSICSEDKVIEHYKKLKGVTRGEAIVQ